jgi:P27 family predicted phage terminase small subunit
MAFKFSDAPPVLDEVGKKEWARICRQLNKHKLADELDYQLVTAYCSAYSDFIKYQNESKSGRDIFTTEKGYEVKSPVATLKREAMDSMLKFAKELGIGPANRKRLGLMDEVEEDEFTAFLKKGKAKKA